MFDHGISGSSVSLWHVGDLVMGWFMSEFPN